VVDRELPDKTCKPYAFDQLQAAADALKQLEDVSINSLEAFEEDCTPDQLARLYPYQPLHLLTSRENTELFDTGVDLTGSDLDISRFIRTDEERDLSVFWAEWEQEQPPADLRPMRDGLCSVPVYEAEKWLKLNKKGIRGKVWLWDYLDNLWMPDPQNALRPGMTLLIHASVGGYAPDMGFTGKAAKKTAIQWQEGVVVPKDRSGDSGQDREDLSVLKQYYNTIATHGRQTAEAVNLLAQPLDLPEGIQERLDQAARFHDLGKVHIAFRSNILDSSVPDLAKAPDNRWKPMNRLYEHERCGKRRGFRHEMASACALFELLARFDRSHPALLGPYGEYLAQGILPTLDEPPLDNSVLTRELAALDRSAFNLLTYLICAHHGKIRASWQATPHDQDFTTKDTQKITMGTGQPLRGLREGDELPSCRLTGNDGHIHTTPPLTLHLDLAALGLSARYGESWSERCLDLQKQFGTYTLAYWETILRVADARASALDIEDSLLEGEQA
jgi:CRISPR-associated endonuclease/helicase Cas3